MNTKWEFKQTSSGRLDFSSQSKLFYQITQRKHETHPNNKVREILEL